MDAIAQPCYVHIAREERKVGIQLTHGGYESLKVPEAIEFNQVKEESHRNT